MPNTTPGDRDERITFLELAEEVLRDTQQPLSITQIWNRAVELGLPVRLNSWDPNSPPSNPQGTLNAAIANSLTRDEERFFEVALQPRRVVLFQDRERFARQGEAEAAAEELLQEDVDEAEDDAQEQEAAEGNGVGEQPHEGFLERDMHPFLVYFARQILGIACKTIPHHVTNRARAAFLRWKHPDIVGCTLPFELFVNETLQLGAANGNDRLKFYSFELKRRIGFGSVAQSFFQAVSNSLWANEGYLVTTEPEFEVLEELKRLSTQFGIGIIILDMSNPDNSEVASPARRRDQIDYNRVNELVVINSEFRQFIQATTGLLTANDHMARQGYMMAFDAVAETSEALIQGLHRPRV